ncbi:short chain dehydrogenase/reductase family oxidoreductase [Fonsecaea pedrosoi]|nr:short chain dehydrogenase/reductase family oxidoreductase [Fonsecaea pedrosoi]
MAYAAYQKGVVDYKNVAPPTNLEGKGVVITGAHVTFGDLDEESGTKLEAELAPNAKFIRCDVTSWEDQLAMFKLALSSSPRKSIDVVVANAGISGPDDAFTIEDTDEPVKPQLKIVNIDLLGVMYTMKLARHYFVKHPLDASHDRCLIVNASLVGFLDVPGIPQYVATTILSPTVQEYCKSKGIVFAEAKDAAGAWIKIASDPSINGRSFGIVPRDAAPQGYMDLGKDDYADGDYLDELQDILLRTSHRLAVKAESQ